MDDVSARVLSGQARPVPAPFACRGRDGYARTVPTPIWAPMTVEGGASGPWVPRTAIPPVNVSSLPQRSPFRYSGGKTWLTPRIREWLSSFPEKPAVLLDPFLGGGSVPLCAVAENLVDHAILAELDPQVAVVWEVIINGDAENLIEAIVSFECTRDRVVEALAVTGDDDVARAFQTVLRNRVQHGGIMSPNAGLMKGGENGKGISSRWYPETLKKRIEKIVAYRDRLTFVHGDGLTVLEEHSGDKNCVAFLDPPYTAGGKRAGSRLYGANDLDHERLFRLAATCQGDVLLTYDNAPEVRELAAWAGFRYARIAMRTNHHQEATELLIGRNLEWFGSSAGNANGNGHEPSLNIEALRMAAGRTQ